MYKALQTVGVEATFVSIQRYVEQEEETRNKEGVFLVRELFNASEGSGRECLYNRASEGYQVTVRCLFVGNAQAACKFKQVRVGFSCRDNVKRKIGILLPGQIGKDKIDLGGAGPERPTAMCVSSTQVLLVKGQ